MIKLRDHYFVAWLVAKKNKSYKITNNKEILVDMSQVEYSNFLTEYQHTDKQTLSKIRNLIRELNQKVS